MKQTMHLLVAAGLLLLAGGCGDDPLADDPKGREACDKLVQARENAGDVEVKVGSVLGAGKAAVEAEDEGIRGAVGEPVEGLEDFPMVDEEKLAAACEDAGVEVPDATE